MLAPTIRGQRRDLKQIRGRLDFADAGFNWSGFYLHQLGDRAPSLRPSPTRSRFFYVGRERVKIKFQIKPPNQIPGRIMGHMGNYQRMTQRGPDNVEAELERMTKEHKPKDRSEEMKQHGPSSTDQVPQQRD